MASLAATELQQKIFRIWRLANCPVSHLAMAALELQQTIFRIWRLANCPVSYLAMAALAATALANPEERGVAKQNLQTISSPMSPCLVKPDRHPRHAWATPRRSRPARSVPAKRSQQSQEQQRSRPQEKFAFSADKFALRLVGNSAMAATKFALRLVGNSAMATSANKFALRLVGNFAMAMAVLVVACRLGRQELPNLSNPEMGVSAMALATNLGCHHSAWKPRCWEPRGHKNLAMWMARAIQGMLTLPVAPQGSGDAQTT